jgi:hypothetical protein
MFWAFFAFNGASSRHHDCIFLVNKPNAYLCKIILIMEGSLRIIGYHTCRASGGWHYIFENAPFISQSNSNQWLTQGYYFWTDSDYWAQNWGETSIRGGHAILRCIIEIDKAYLLDLVGSVGDQIKFYELLETYHNKLKKADPNAETPTVHAVLCALRLKAQENKAYFPYVAIKAADQKYEKFFHFTDKKKEKVFLVTRQQLCVFENAHNYIIEKNPIYPSAFAQGTY